MTASRSGGRLPRYLRVMWAAAVACLIAGAAARPLSQGAPGAVDPRPAQDQPPPQTPTPGQTPPGQPPSPDQAPGQPPAQPPPPVETPPAAQAAPPPQEEAAVLVGAGDIANCEITAGSGARGTARLLDSIPGTVFTVGDHAYPSGTAKQFQDCYDPTWGRHKARTRPAAGNHDYLVAQAKAFFDYFGDAAGPERRGYYSYDVGAWHIIVLNSNIAANRSSPQIDWMRKDLEQHRSVCTLAYWHIPVFSSGPHGAEPQTTAHMLDAWQVLYEAGADVVINGHDHHYERFAPQDPKGKADPKKGIREFIVGTGGGGLYEFRRVRPNSEARSNRAYGVLKLTLRASDYSWEFVQSAGEPFRDTGSSPCVQ